MSSGDSDDTGMVGASPTDFATPAEVHDFDENDLDSDDADAEGDDDTNDHMQLDHDPTTLGDDPALTQTSSNLPAASSDSVKRRGYRARLAQHRDLSIIQHPPPFLAAMRQTLFEVREPVELKPDEFERFWPFVDNVWVRQHKAGADRSGQTTTDYYACRLQRATYAPPRKEENEQDPTKQRRRKKAREGGTCQCRVKVVHYVGEFSRVTVTRVSSSVHSHDLDALDELKRNSVVMDVARTEVMKGYLPASVFSAMRADPQRLANAGGKFMKVNDVRNASQSWRRKHTSQLLCHPEAALAHHIYVGQDHDAAAHTTAAQAAAAGAAGGSAGEMKVALSTSVADPAPPPPPPLLPPETLFFPPPSAFFLYPYLPPVPAPGASTQPLPHVTLSYATSLDSMLALGPNIPTPISSLPTKAMTHYLRSRHDAILIGVGTAICDNPTLNCRLAGAGGYGGVGWSSHPRPVIIDPGARWDLTADAAVLQAAKAGKGRAPWVVVQPRAHVPAARITLLQKYGGKFVMLPDVDQRFRLRWRDIFRALAEEGVRSVLVEGGATVASELLSRPENRPLVSTVVLTVAPTYLGQGSVAVGPARALDAAGLPTPAVRFVDVRWCPLGDDAVLCARLSESPPLAAGPAPQQQLAPTGPAASAVAHDPASTAAAAATADDHAGHTTLGGIGDYPMPGHDDALPPTALPQSLPLPSPAAPDASFTTVTASVGPTNLFNTLGTPTRGRGRPRGRPPGSGRGRGLDRVQAAAAAASSVSGSPPPPPPHGTLLALDTPTPLPGRATGAAASRVAPVASMQAQLQALTPVQMQAQAQTQAQAQEEMRRRMQAYARDNPF